MLVVFVDVTVVSMKCSQSKHFFYRRLLFRQALVGIATCHYQFTIIKEEQRINAISDMLGESIKSLVSEE